MCEGIEHSHLCKDYLSFQAGLFSHFFVLCVFTAQEHNISFVLQPNKIFC